MIKFSLRLQAIADLVDDNSRIIDVGCDHGYLDIYLSKYKNCRCLATDVSELCLKKAQANIEKFGLQNAIETKVTYGLDNIDYKNYDLIIISGMGFQTIDNILKDKHPNKLIIQSNNNIEELRYKLLKEYRVLKEKIIFEHNIYYVILYLEKGKENYKYSDYIIGFNKDNKSYIEYLYHKYLDIYNKMPNKYILKKLKLYHKLSVLRKYKKY